MEVRFCKTYDEIAVLGGGQLKDMVPLAGNRSDMMRLSGTMVVELRVSERKAVKSVRACLGLNSGTKWPEPLMVMKEKPCSYCER